MGNLIRDYGFVFILIAAVVAIGAYSLPRNAGPSADMLRSEQAPSQHTNNLPAVAASSDSGLGQSSWRESAEPQGVVHVGEDDFERVVLDSDVPVLVDFYADWCAPCRQLAPVLEELARETPGAKVVKVDVDDNPALASEFGISSIPSLLVFKNGRLAARKIGGAGKGELRAMLR